jgi:Bacteriophage head to tail connecting protein.
MLPEWERWRRLFAPKRGRFLPGDGPRKSAKRKNSHPFKTTEEFAAGMQSGLASPSRKWFAFGLFDQLVATLERAKAWIGQASDITAARMLQTNFFDQITSFWREEGIFGTAAMFIEEDDEDVFYCKTLTAGQFAIGEDHKGRVNRFCREMRYTAQQLEQDFGIENLPRDIQEELKDRTRRDSPAKHTVRHLIQPNEKYQADTLGPAGMRYQSLWWLVGQQEPAFLRVSGYNEFPVVVGRWNKIADDVYGHEHPGELAEDDAATLQDLETDARGAIERGVKPAMIAPRSLLGKLDNRPNAVTYYDAMQDGQAPKIEALHNVNFAYEAAENKIAMLKQDIDRAWYVDLFRMLSSDTRTGRSATEIAAREEEKAYIMAPITMRQTSEVLTVALIRIFGIMNRAGMFPEVPPELAGRDVKIEYMSEFALLQKRAAQSSIETVLMMAEMLAKLQGAGGKPPEVLDRIDADEVLEVIADMHAIPAGIILGDDAVAGTREDRAMQMAQTQQMQQVEQTAALAPEVAKATKDMSQAEMEGGGSALDALMAALGGGAPGEGG